ncbi:AlpA family transcriptional regulator [Anaeromyxobacter sp. Fw109-5]|uniref:helix-turn-helix transcriptional regulator n=1 Tax=Anaeromyxobacter sp. (strain Fw109-5) TaxID=404589 RepID=UPI0000ED7758|nr:hypothetical protein [Anaeromyxobacter sp. Fw109-5]ABS24822.1 hypothetical protein Anae109_0609 [Anaeromyxobacter sp. Fw109-5]
MAETRVEQVAFGWAGEGTTDTAELPPEASPSTSPPLRGGYARGERVEGRASNRKVPARSSAESPRAEAPRVDALPPDNELWDVHAGVRFLKRSVSWVYHRAEDGTLPVKRIGGWRLRFIPAELRAWVEASGEPRRKVARGSKEYPMGSVYKRGRTGWLKYKDATGTLKPEATKAATKTEAKALLHEIERRVERQRLGPEPISLNPEGWTVGDLLQWWLDTYSHHSPSHEKNLGTVRRLILGAPLAEKPLQHVQPGDVEQLLQAMEGEVSARPSTTSASSWSARSTTRARRRCDRTTASIVRMRRCWRAVQARRLSR